MTDSLGITLVVYAIGVALSCGVLALTARPRPAPVNAALAILQGGAVLHALLDGLALLRGDHRAETATNLGYLLTSLAVLPIAGSAIRMDQNRWGNAAFAVASALFAVVTVRMHQTLGPARG